MDFGGSDDPEAVATANDLLRLVSDYLSKVEPSLAKPWYENELGTLYDSHGDLRHAKEAAWEIYPRWSEDDWKVAFGEVDTIAKTIKQLNSDVVAYAKDLDDLSPEDKEAHGEVIEQAYSSIMAPAIMHVARYEALIKHESVSELELVEQYLVKLRQIRALCLTGVNQLTHLAGLQTTQVIRWFLWNLYYDLDNESRYRLFYDDKYPICDPQTILTNLDSAEASTDSDNIVVPYKTWLTLIGDNHLYMASFVRNGGVAYLHKWLADGLAFLSAHPEEADRVRDNLFTAAEYILNMFDLLISICAHITSSTFNVLCHLHGITTYTLSLCAAVEMKEKGADSRNYESFATRLITHHYWLLDTVIHTRSPTSFFSTYLAEIVDKYQLYIRQFVLHSSAKQQLGAVYDITMQIITFLQEMNPVDWRPPVIGKIRTSFGEITTFPKFDEVPSPETLFAWHDSGLVREYFDEKIEKIRQHPDDAASQFSEEDHEKRKVSPLAVIAMENPKRAVDPQTVFGRIHFVTGPRYHFRVKVVRTDADLDVKLVNRDGAATSPGHWHVITAGREDFRLKIVKTGVYDFTIKYL